MTNHLFLLEFSSGMDFMTSAFYQSVPPGLENSFEDQKGLFLDRSLCSTTL